MITQPSESWLEQVSKIDPSLGNPELWTDDVTIDRLVTNAGVHNMVHRICENIFQDLSLIEGGIVSTLMLGYFIGRLSVQKEN